MPSTRKHQPSLETAINIPASEGPIEPRHVHHRRVDGDGVLKVALVFDHHDHERLAAGHVEGIDAALQDAERKQQGDRYVTGKR